MDCSPSLSAVYPHGDPQRTFTQGNQEQLPNLMTGCWKHCTPTPERINEDISGWPAVAENRGSQGLRGAGL